MWIASDIMSGRCTTVGREYDTAAGYFEQQGFDRGAVVKSLFRLIGLALMFSGWGVAALCLHVVRMPNPANPAESKLLVLPKVRVGISDTYVDARNWTLADVPNHPALFQRVIDAGKSDDFRYLADPHSGESVQTQLSNALPGETPRGLRTGAATEPQAWLRNRLAHSQTSIAGFDLSGLFNLPIDF
jgi:hypothetical protein